MKTVLLFSNIVYNLGKHTRARMTLSRALNGPLVGSLTPLHAAVKGSSIKDILEKPVFLRLPCPLVSSFYQFPSPLRTSTFSRLLLKLCTFSSECIFLKTLFKVRNAC